MSKGKIVFFVIAFAIVATIVGVGIFVMVSGNRQRVNGTPQQEQVHYHAIFEVYVNDELQDYSDFRYMEFEPCGEDHIGQTPDEVQLEKAHLHDFVDDVVHVHISGATWGDLFKNIRVELQQPLTAYEDGKVVENILEKPIKQDSRVLLITGSGAGAEDKLSKMPEIEYLREVESQSELCGSGN